MKIIFGYWDTRKLAKGITKSFADLTFYWTKTTGDTLVKEVIDDSTSSSIIASDNINTIIKQASIESADFLFVVPSGTMFLNPVPVANGLLEFIKTDPAIAGHIIDHSIKNNNWKSFFGLHEQCILISKRVINDIVNECFTIEESFEYNDISWPLIDRSESNIHDNYTPLWIKKGTEETVQIEKKNSEFCLFHDLIKFVINKNYTVHNLPQELRNYRTYTYHLTRPNDLEALIDKPLSEINKIETQVKGHKEFLIKWKTLLNPEAGFWAYNTESTSIDKDLKVDCFIAVASGIIPWSYLAKFDLQPNSNIYFVDVNQNCLDFQKYILDNLYNFFSYKDIVNAFNKDRGLIKFGSKSQSVDEDGLLTEIKEKWNIIKTCNFHFVKGDIIQLNDDIKQSVKTSNYPYVWFSNVLRYIPSLTQLYQDDSLQAYLTELLSYNLNFSWSGIGINNHRSSGPNSTPNTAGNFYKTLDIKLPYKDFVDEIESLENLNLFTRHRSDNYVKGMQLHRGWSSFVIHGLGYNKTEGYEVYGYANNDDAPYDWTPEALEHCPKLVAWFKEKKFKDKYHRVRIMKLAPGGMVGLHNDNPEPNTWATNMAINNPEGCEMHFWDKNWQYLGQVPWKPGDTNRIRIGYYHIVINKSNKARYHMITHGEGGWM